jgi:hypothetical protein
MGFFVFITPRKFAIQNIQRMPSNCLSTFITLLALFCFLPSFAQIRLATPPAPENITLSGPLQKALSASENGRLKYFINGPESPAVRIYHRDSVRVSKSDGWDGECAGKWLYSTAKAYHRTHDPILKANLISVADFLVSQQSEDGYLGTYNDTARFTGNPMHPRETFDLWMNGYMMQGLMETYNALQQPAYLEAAKKIADLCIRTFQTGPKKIAYSGPWHGMASVCVMEHFADLYGITHEPQYLRFAYFSLKQLQDRPDARFLTKMLGREDVSDIAEGKMYEMLHCLVGISKMYKVSGDTTLLPVMLNGWEKVSVHVNPAGGPAGGTNVFVECFDRKNFFSPYSNSETCAMMDWLRFNKELFEITGEARFADEMEKTTYNALLGAAFEDGFGWAYHSILNGPKTRTAPFACCSSSGAMALEEVPDLFYSSYKDKIMINLLGPGSAKFDIGKQQVTVEQVTEYPFDGEVNIRIKAPSAVYFTLEIRIPDWAQQAEVTAGGTTYPATAGKYFQINKRWPKETTIRLHLKLPWRAVVAGTQSEEFAAFYKGPLLYASTWKDTKEKPEPLFIKRNLLDALHKIKRNKGENAGTYTLPLEKDQIELAPYITITSGNKDAYHTTWFHIGN